MRRRVVRDLGTLAGVVVIIGVIVAINIYFQLDSLTKAYTAMREKAEAERIAQGHQLLDWDLMRETKGNYRRGGTFHQDLKAWDGKVVNLMGFMTPIDQFREVTHFMLLPVPIECYFCEAPPPRDIVLVEMNPEEPVNIVEEPVLVSGELVLHEGEDVNFFYTVRMASREPGEMGGTLTEKSFEQDHFDHMVGGAGNIMGEEADEELLQGIEPPAGTTSAPPEAPAEPESDPAAVVEESTPDTAAPAPAEEAPAAQ